MSDTWRIGSVTLPIPPQKITSRSTRVLRKVSTTIQPPWLLDFGGDVPILTLQGKIAEGMKTVDELEESYIIPLKRMVTARRNVFPVVLGDDNMIASGNWVGCGRETGDLTAATISDSTEQVAKGENSVKAVISTGGTYGYSGIERSFDTPQNWQYYDFLSFWAYGLGSGYFAVQLYDGTATQTKVQSDVSGWHRYIFLLSDFTAIDLSNVERVRIMRSTAGTTYFDRIVVGIGQEVSAPGKRYDGIYIIRRFDSIENKGEIASFDYNIELWSYDHYY